MADYNELKTLCEDIVKSGVTGLQVSGKADDKKAEFEAQLLIGEISLTIVFDGTRKDFVDKMKHVRDNFDYRAFIEYLYQKYQFEDEEVILKIAQSSVESFNEIIRALGSEKPLQKGFSIHIS